jgi:hypothetical protein
MYKYSIKDNWEIIPNKFVVENVDDELFHFGFFKSEIKFKIEDDEFFQLSIYENHKNLIEEKFLIHLCFFEQIYEVLIPDLPDLLSCLKEIRTSLIWQ